MPRRGRGLVVIGASGRGTGGGVSPPSLLTLAPVASDTFAGADGTLVGGNWIATTDGSMARSSNEAIGTAGSVKGNYRTETYSTSQYSEVTIGSVHGTSGSFIGPTVRNTSAGHCYAALSFNNGGNLEFDLYKRSAAGSLTRVTQGLGATTTAVTAGTILRLVAEGTQLTLLVNGQPYWSIQDVDLAGGAPGVISFGAVTASLWTGGNASTTALGSALASDSFNRADGDPTTGQPWQTMTGYPAVFPPIVSNQLNPTTGTHTAMIRTESGFWLPDQWASIQVGGTALAPNGGGFIGLVLRGQTDLIRGYLVCAFASSDPRGVINQGYSYRIYRLDAPGGVGASTFLNGCNSGNNDGGSLLNLDPAGTELDAVAQGSRISLRVRGHEVLAVTDTTYTSGKPGTMLYPSATTTADSWAAGNV